SFNVTGALLSGTNLGLNTPLQLQLWDSLGGAGGHFVVNNVAQTAGHEIDLNVGDPAFNTSTFLSSMVPGTDRLSARLKLNDGTLTPWVSFTVTVAEPSITINNTAAIAANSSSINVLGGLLTINDPSGVGYTQLQLWDSLG